MSKKNNRGLYTTAGLVISSIRHKRHSTEDDTVKQNDLHSEDNTADKLGKVIWKNEEDIISKFYITTNPSHNHELLLKSIELDNCQPGEVSIWVKRSFPKAARFHNKRQDTDPYRYFLSELMLYKGFTDEDELGINNEDTCKNLYFKHKDAIQDVKMHLLPYAQAVEEARHYVTEALQNSDLESEN